MTVTQADRDAMKAVQVALLVAGAQGDQNAWRRAEEAFAKHREDANRPLLERIEKLEAENMRLREALQPFTRENSSEAFLSIRVKSSDVKRARQALGETQ